MVTLREVTSALYGSWRLARRDPAAMMWFDRSREGCIRSFWSAAICYPGFLVLLLLRLTPDQTQAGLPQILLIETIGYVIGWTAYPLAALAFCRRVASEEQSLGFITAYNWSQVLQTALLLPVACVGATSLLPDYVIAYADTIAYIAILVYEWFIARIALSKGAMPALALVLLDVVLGAVISEVTQSLYGAG
ncbi:MAG TPA: hypothetical protein VL993_04320 [Stellaceae bacterium]|nr:hypothetical protein [Stellaceae bacterium]